MYMANPARVSLRFCVVLCSLLCLLSACAGVSASPGTSGTTQATGTAPGNSSGSISPTYTLPDEGVAASIPVSSHPEIEVESGSAVGLTFVGSDTQTITTNLYSLPYQKKGNTVIINFGQTIGQALTIKIPRESNLSVTLSAGNVIVESVQGQVNVSMASGTIQVTNFTPSGTDTIQTNSGTITVTFTKDASCSLTAQTNFGAIVSGYSTISEKRSGSKDEASGTLNGGNGATVNLTVGDGSITIGPV